MVVVVCLQSFWYLQNKKVLKYNEVVKESLYIIFGEAIISLFQALHNII